MPDSYKELIKGKPNETEIRSFLVEGNQVSKSPAARARLASAPS